MDISDPQSGTTIQQGLQPSILVRKEYDLSRLPTAPHRQEEISSVEYAFDLVPDSPTYLAVSDFPFPRIDLVTDDHHRSFAIKLQPRLSGLPYRCGLDAVYENRFWKSCFESSRTLLELLAADRSETDFVVGNGVTVAKLAQKMLKPGMEHLFCKATTYMFPFCSEERIRLLSALMVILFVFDGRVFFRTF